jgi:hypothetical protein
MDLLDQRDWQAKIPEKTIFCIECGKLFEEMDMKKIFARGEGICKECWNFDEEGIRYAFGKTIGIGIGIGMTEN